LCVPVLAGCQSVDTIPAIVAIGTSVAVYFSIKTSRLSQQQTPDLGKGLVGTQAASLRYHISL
jgi:hypothetical protein